LNEVVLAYYRFGGTMIVITILLPWLRQRTGGFKATIFIDLLQRTV
jgi:hypothetical protein